MDSGVKAPDGLQRGRGGERSPLLRREGGREKSQRLLPAGPGGPSEGALARMVSAASSADSDLEPLRRMLPGQAGRVAAVRSLILLNFNQALR